MFLNSKNWQPGCSPDLDQYALALNDQNDLINANKCNQISFMKQIMPRERKLNALW